MVYIHVKNYDHFNRAMNKHISSRAEYEKEMVKGGYVPFEQGQAMAEKRNNELRKPYDKISDKALKLCYAAKEMSDKKGNLKASDRLIKGMEDCGVNFYSQLPKHYQDKGGFDAS